MVLNSHPIKKIDSRLSIRPETDNAGELKRLMQVNNLNSIYSKYYYSYYSGTCLIRHTRNHGNVSDCTGCRNTQVLF
jgi:hypothetical protein